MIVKSVGSNGQITLGKEFAGRLVMLDQTEPGVWTMKLGQFIPDSEKWLHTSEAKAALNEGLAIAPDDWRLVQELGELLMATDRMREGAVLMKKSGEMRSQPRAAD